MSTFALNIYLSYAQLCIFISSLPRPYNDWSERSYSQGFSWRAGSASFRALTEEGEHEIRIFLEEPVPELSSDVVRAFKVPFDVSESSIEIASVSESLAFELSPAMYSLQVEFLDFSEVNPPKINVRLNKGKVGFSILRADAEINREGDFDINALPAT